MELLWGWQTNRVRCKEPIEPIRILKNCKNSWCFCLMCYRGLRCLMMFYIVWVCMRDCREIEWTSEFWVISSMGEISGDFWNWPWGPIDEAVMEIERKYTKHTLLILLGKLLLCSQLVLLGVACSVSSQLIAGSQVGIQQLTTVTTWARSLISSRFLGATQCWPIAPTMCS